MKGVTRWIRRYCVIAVSLLMFFAPLTVYAEEVVDTVVEEEQLVVEEELPVVEEEQPVVEEDPLVVEEEQPVVEEEQPVVEEEQPAVEEEQPVVEEEQPVVEEEQPVVEEEQPVVEEEQPVVEEEPSVVEEEPPVVEEEQAVVEEKTEQKIAPVVKQLQGRSVSMATTLNTVAEEEGVVKETESDATEINITQENADTAVIDVVDDGDGKNQLKITLMAGDETESITVYSKTEQITSLTINVKNLIQFGSSISEEAADGQGETLNMGLAAVLLWAEKVLLVTEDNFTWNVKSLTAKASPSAPTSANVFASYVEHHFDSNTYEVQIKNTTINANEGIIQVQATNKYGEEEEPQSETIKINTGVMDEELEQEEQQTEEQKKQWEELQKQQEESMENKDASQEMIEALNDATGQTSFFVSVKPEEALIIIDGSTLTGQAVDVEAKTTAHVNTMGIGVGLAVNVIVADTLVTVKDSALKAIGGNTVVPSEDPLEKVLPSGSVSIKAETDIHVTGEAKGKVGFFAIAVSIAVGDTCVDVSGTDITATGDIEIAAENTTISTATALGQKKNEKQSGIFVGVSVVDGNTYAAVRDSQKKQSNLNAGGDVRVISNRFGTTTTSATSQTHYKDVIVKSNDLESTISRLTYMIKRTVKTIGVKNMGGSFLEGKFPEEDINAKMQAALKSAGDVEDLQTEGVESASATSQFVLSYQLKSTQPTLTGNVTATVTNTETGNAVAVITLTDTNKAETLSLAAGKYKVSVSAPGNYNAVKDFTFTLKDATSYTKEILLKDANYQKNQLVGSVAVAVVNAGNTAYIETAGTIRAGGDVNVEANGITQTTTLADASAIDRVFDKYPEDGTIYVSVMTPNMMSPVDSVVYLEYPDGQTFQNTVIDKEQKIHMFPDYNSGTGDIALGLKEGTYKVIFSFDGAKYQLNGGVKATPLLNRPAYISETIWKPTETSTIVWYVLEVQLELAQRMLKDGAGAVVFNPLTGAPIMTEYVQGTMEIITLKPLNPTQDTEAQGKSIGVGVGINIINNDNIAYIKNAAVYADNVTVIARNGDDWKQAIDMTQVGAVSGSMSSVSSVSGFSSGDFGLAGAITVNVTDELTQALLDNVKIYITKESGNVSVEADSLNGTTTTATGTPVKGVSAGAGVGSSIAVNVFTSDVNSEITGTTTIQASGNGSSVGNVTVRAESKGTSIGTSTAGSKGGKSISPAVMVNVISADTTAKLSEVTANQTASVLNLVGQVTVEAISKRKSSAAANAATAGSDVAVGGAVTVDVISLNQTAVLERTISGAADIRVHSEAVNGSDTSSQAGANGAAEKKEKKATDSSGNETTAQGESPSADDSANTALKAGKEVAGSGSKAASKIPNEIPQKAETSEGAVTVAGGITILIWNDNTEAILKGNTTSSGLLDVTAETCETINVTADAAATVSKTGVGVSVAILVADVKNHATVEGTHKAGSINVTAGMPMVDVYEYDTTTLQYVPTGEKVKGRNTIEVFSQSGAGASNVGVAGAVVINVYTADYLAKIKENADITLTTANTEDLVEAEMLHCITTKAGASEDMAAAGSSAEAQAATKKTGVGASFATTISKLNTNAIVAENAKINTKGTLKVHADSQNETSASAMAGADAYVQQGAPSSIMFEFLDGSGKKFKDQGVYVNVSRGLIPLATNVMIPDSTGTYVLDATNGLLSEAAEYTLKIVSVPVGYAMPNQTTYVIKISDPGSEGFLRTIVLYKIGEKPGEQYASVDAAAALNIISAITKAQVENGANVNADGDLIVDAYSKNDTLADTKGTAKATNVAVGATVAVNVVDDVVNAQFDGTATVVGNVQVTAQSDSVDVADAESTAAGLQLDRYKSKLNMTLDELMAGFKNKLPSSSSSSSVQTGPTNITKAIDTAIFNRTAGGTSNSQGANTSLMMKVLEALGVKVTETQVNTGTTATTTDSTTTTSTSAATAKNEATGTTNPTGQTTQNDTKIAVAAAVGVNVGNHETSAKVGGTIHTADTGDVTVKAVNNNNFKALATGAAVSSETAIALGVAVVVNTSKAIAEVTGNIGAETEKAGSVLVSADTNINVTDDFRDDIAAQAVAGAGKGSEEGAAVAGAVAIFVNDAQTMAALGDGIAVYADGKVEVLATEKSKLAVRAWGASIGNSLFDEQNGTGANVGGTTGSAVPSPGAEGSGIGAAFAILYANSDTTASVGNNVYIMADSLDVIAKKLRVSTSDYSYDGIQLNGRVTIGTKPQYVLQINTTDKPDSAKALDFEDLFQEGISLLNVLASKNYYVEAAGGAVAENSKLSGAGSFALIIMNDAAEAVIGNNVTLVLTDDANVLASSDINMVTIGGALAYGSGASAGLSSTVIINNGDVTAVIGDSLGFTGTDLTTDADANMDVLTLLVAAAVSGKNPTSTTTTKQTAVNGVLNVYVSDMNITAGIGEDANITAGGDVKVRAEHTLKHVGVVGGAALSSGVGVGASVGVLVINQNVLAYLAQGANVNATNISVLASQESKLYEIIVNGAAAAGAEASVAVAVSPAVHVVKNSTKAYLGAPKANGEAVVTKGSIINAKNNVDVKATDTTFILVLSGGAAVSTQNSSVGGSVQVNVFLKEVAAKVGTGSSDKYVQIYAPGTLTIEAVSKEDIYSFVVGLGGGSKASVSGSVDVLVVSNQTEAVLGDYAHVGSSTSKGNVMIKASDALTQAAGAGAVTVSANGAAIGLSNVDVILDGEVLAETGANAVVYAEDVQVIASSDNLLVSIAVSGGVSSGGSTVTGSIVVVVVEQTTKALIDKNTEIYADAMVMVDADSKTILVDAVGSLGVGASGASVSGAVDTVVFGGKTLAIVEKGVIIDAEGNILVTADADENLTNVVIGAAASTGNAAVTGTAAVIVKQQLVAAILGSMNEDTYTADGTGLQIQTPGSILVSANSEGDLLVLSGSLAGSSGTAGVSAGVIVVTDEHVTWAEIGSGAVVDAQGKDTALEGAFGAVETKDVVADSNNTSINYKKKNRKNQQVYGVLVGAYSNSALNLIAVSAAGGSTAGVTAATATLVESEKTIARINTNAEVNTRSRESGAKASVHVVSIADTSESVAGGGAAIGGTAGVSAAIVTFVGNKQTLAEIGDGSVVNAEEAISVLALSETGLYVNGIGFAAGGTAGVGATSSVLVMQDSTKAIAGGTLNTNNGSITVLADADEILQISATTATGGGTAGVGAAVAVLVFKGETIAKVTAGANLTAGADIIIRALSDEIVVMTVVGAAGGGTAGISGSLGVIVMNVTTQAMMDDSKQASMGSMNAGGNIVVEAIDNTNLVQVVGGAAGGGAVGAGASIEVAVYRSTVTAKVGNYNRLEAKAMTVHAKADRMINTHAVMAAAGGTANINGVVIVLSVGANTSDADADDLDGNEGLSTDASQMASNQGQNAADAALGQQIETGNNNAYITDVNSTLSDISVSLNGSNNLVAGYFTLAEVEDKTAALIGNGGSTTTTAGDVVVKAEEETDIYATAGSGGGSGAASVGLSANIGLIASTVEASLGGNVTSAGNVVVEAISTLNVGEFTAVSGGGAGAAAVAGTVTVLKTTAKTFAMISEKAVVTADNNVVVNADSDVDILVINGNAGGAGAAAVGAAVNVVIFGGHTKATIEADRITAHAKGDGVEFVDGGITSNINKNTTLNSDNTDTDAVSSEASKSVQKGVLVGAHSAQKLRNWVVSAGGAGAASVMGSINVLTFEETTEAYIQNAVVLVDHSTADIVVLAVDHSAIQNVVGNAGGAGAAAVGLGNDTIYFEKTVSARVENAKLTSGRHILVLANGKEDMLSVVVGAGGAGAAAVNSSDAVAVVKNIVGAVVSDSTLIADGSILVSAEDEQNYVITAGSANGAGAAAVGAGVVVLTSANTVKASVEGTSELDALGNTGINVYDGTFTGTGKDRKRNKSLQYGVIIGAFNQSDLFALAYAASGAGAAAVVAASATVVSNANVLAQTAAAVKINQRNREGRSQSCTVKILALDDSSEDVAGGGAAVGGGAGVSAVVVVTVMNKTVSAVGGGTIYGPAGITILADSYDCAVLVAAGVAGGFVGATGNASTLKYNSQVIAYADGTLVSEDTIAILANNTTDIHLVTGSVSGGVVGAGASVLVFLFNGTTKAYVEANSSIAAAALTIQALSGENLTAVSTAVGAGSYAGAISALVVISEVITQAYTDNQVILDISGALKIHAADTPNYTLNAATASLGGVAAGGAVTVLIFKNTVSAYIGTNNTVNAGVIDILAKTDRILKVNAAAGGAAVSAVSGSVVVITIGGTVADADSKKALGSLSTEAQNSVNGSFAEVKLEHKAGDQRNGKNIREAANGFMNGMTIDLNAYFNAASLLNKVLAAINQGSKVTVKGQITVKAEDSTNLDTISGMAAAGGLAAGGSVLITHVNGNTESYVGGTITGTNSPDMDVISDQTIEAKDYRAYAGTAGLVGGLGAAISYLEVNGINKAYTLSDSDISGFDVVNVKAQQTITANPQVAGASAGAVAAGVTTAVLKVQGINEVNLAGKKIEANTLNAHAVQDITANIEATAAAGGAAGSASASVAQMTMTASNKLLSSAELKIADTAELLANTNLSAAVKSYGTAVAGGAAVGVTKVAVTINPVIEAKTKGKITVGKSFSVYALYNKNKSLNNTSHKIEVDAKGGSGAVLAAGNGIEVNVTQSGSVTAAHEGDEEVHVGTITSDTGTALNSSADKTTTKNICYIAGSHTNMNVTAGGKTFAGGAAIGAVIVSMEDRMTTRADVQGILAAEDDILIQAVHTSNVTGNVTGNSGGLLVAGTAQKLTVTTYTETEAKAGGNIRAGYDFGLLSYSSEDVNGTVKGWAVSGFASGGASQLSFNLTNRTVTRVVSGANIMTGRHASIGAYCSVDKYGHVTASLAAVGGSACDTSESTTYNYRSWIDLGSSGNTAQVKINAGHDIDILAKSEHKHYGYGTAVTAAALAIGKVTVSQSGTDKVNVYLYAPYLQSNAGAVNILADANFKTEKLEAVGGAGGLYNGNSVEVSSKLNQYATIEAGKQSNLYTEIHTLADKSITLQTTTLAYVFADAQINFTVSGLNTLGTNSYNQMTINSEIKLGEGTKINSAGDIYLNALIKQIYAYAESYSKTTAVVNTQSRPKAEVSVTGTAKISGNQSQLTAAKTLQILADAYENGNIYIRAYAFGETAGGTGSVISTAKNNTTLKANISMTGADSVYQAKDILIEASVPRQENVQYSKKAEYKAYTVTEFVKKTVEKVVEVVEKVTEKVCKWLPWPFNKIVKWIVKTVVKLVRVVEEVIVEVVLQSETDAVEQGSYRYENSIELYGDIYYGSNAPVSIVIDENGNISDPFARYHKDGNKLIIDSYDSKAMGSLIISSLAGIVKGDVRVHTRSMITDMTITNNSLYDLVIGNLNLQSNEDEDSCNYFIYCSDDSDFKMEDVIDILAAQSPSFHVITNTGKSVTYDGVFSYYAADMLFRYNGEAGDLFMGENGLIGIHSLTVINARNVGTAQAPWNNSMYVVQKNDDTWMKPTVNIEASGDVYVNFTVKKYVEAADEAAKQAAIEANKNIESLLIEKITAGGNVNVTMNPAVLVIGLLTDSEVPMEYTYTKNELKAEVIDGEVVLDVKQETEEFAHLVYVKDSDGELKYYKDEDCTEEYDNSYTGRILYVKLIENTETGESEQKYYQDAACTEDFENMELQIVTDTEGFADYLVTTETKAKGYTKTTYTAIDKDSYRWVEDTDEEGNGLGTGRILITIDGAERELAENESIQYLKKIGQNLYTDVISIIGYKLVSKSVTYVYYKNEIAEGNELTGYHYFAKDEKDGKWYGYKLAETIVTETTTVATKGTIITEHATGGQYEVRCIKADGNITLIGAAMNDETQIVVNGEVKTSGEKNVSFNGMGNTNLYFETGASFGGESANVTIQAGTVTTTAEGSRAEVEGMTVTIATENGFGTEENPIAVKVKDASGGGLNTADINRGSVYAESYSDLYVNTLKVQEHQTIFLNLHNNGLYGLDENHSITAGTFVVKEAGTVGTEQQNIQTVIGQGGFDVISDGNIYLNQTGDAHIKNIQTEATLSLKTDSGIVNIAEENTAAMTANDFILNAAGNIGTADRAVTIFQKEGGSLTAQTAGNIWIENLSKQLDVKKTESINGIVSLKTKGNMVNAAEDDRDVVSGSAVILSAEESIGTEDKAFAINTESLTADAANRIYADAKDCDVIVDMTASLVDMTAGAINGKINTAVLQAETERNITLEVEAMDELMMDILAPNSAAITVLNGNISNARITTDKLSLNALDGSIGQENSFIETKAYGADDKLTFSMYAFNGIYVQDTSDVLVLETVVSAEGTVHLKAAGTIENGLETESTQANVTGKNIVLEAKSAGSAEKPLTTNLIFDESLAEGENALAVHTENDLNIHDIGTEGIIPKVELVSDNGNLEFKAERVVNNNILRAENGNITIRVAGDFVLGEVNAGKNLNVYATGNITGNLTGDLYIGNFAAGTEEEAKDITLIVTDGNIYNGLTMEADDQVNLTGQKIYLETKLTEEGKAAGKTAGVGENGKPVTVDLASDGILNVQSDDAVYLTEVNTEGTVNIGIMESTNGNVVLETGTNTVIEKLLAENGEADFTVGGDLDVNKLETQKAILKAEGVMNLGAEGDMMLEIYGDALIETLKAGGNLNISANGQLKIADLELLSDIYELIITAEKNAEIHSKEEELRITDITADEVILNNEGAVVIERLDAQKAEITTQGNLSILLIDTEATQLDVITKEGVIDFVSKGDLIMNSSDALNIVSAESNGKLELNAPFVEVVFAKDDVQVNVTAQDAEIEFADGNNKAITNIGKDGSLSVTSKGDLEVEDYGTEGMLTLPVLASDTGNVKLKTLRKVVIDKLYTDYLDANVAGPLSFNASNTLELMLSGKENVLDDITVEGLLRVTSHHNILSNGMIKAENTEFLNMKELNVLMNPSMGDVNIHSREDGKTKVTLRTTEENQTIKFRKEFIEIVTGKQTHKVFFNELPKNLTMEDLGGVNNFHIYTLNIPTTILGGIGDDTYHLGMLCAEDDEDVMFKIHDDGIDGFVSLGNLKPLTIKDTDGKNVYHLRHMNDVVEIYGGAGEDTYILHSYFIWDEVNQRYYAYTPSGFHIYDGLGNNHYIGFPVAESPEDDDACQNGWGCAGLAQTDDSSEYFLWSVLVGMSMVMIILLQRVKKRIR